MKIGINGLGRIGRCLVRALALYPEKYSKLELAAVNGPADILTHKHLLKYDSIHGVLNTDITVVKNTISIGNMKFQVHNAKNPTEIPWDGIDVVLECSGKFNSKALVAGHFQSNSVKKVIISAPAHDADATIVYGVNHDLVTENTDVISAASCTTNSIAPVISAIHSKFRINSAYATTIHAYTSDQNLTDGSHRDLRRGRAACLSIIPTTTGATKAIEKIIPSLKGRILGSAVRVPTANVSMTDLCITTEVNIDSIEAIHDTIIDAANKSDGVLGYSMEPLVSCDFQRSTFSSIVDFCETAIIPNGISRIVAWYDNELAFALRMLDIALLLQKYFEMP